MDPLNLIEKSTGFIRAFEASDVDKMQSYWADGEAMYLMPYASGMFPDTAAGKEGFYELTKDWPEIFEKIELKIVETILDTQARKVVARTEIKLWVKDDGPYENAQIFILRFNESGKLREVSEYYNPVPTAIGLKKFGAHASLLNRLQVPRTR
ncbi:nuclear transport factor 2 family protein [Pontibacter sp. G13]|uniref:nuclear transport factor 2 family protein n=1 Tax=Pontibacter sp. G13 TaxID=3074898 RepID=UPI00288A0F10|nr:nuclear transport factor 2 family protein [Pontibacter sp. G13]WNJ19098.1 nuclear transport factor 2 family protein [Pontibacter sp. G13]